MLIYEHFLCFLMNCKDQLKESDLPAAVSSVPPEPQCADPPGTVACCPQWKHSPGSAQRLCSGLPTSCGLHYPLDQLLGWVGGRFSGENKSNHKLGCLEIELPEAKLYSLISLKKLQSNRVELRLELRYKHKHPHSTSVHLPKRLSSLLWIHCTSTCREHVCWLPHLLARHTLQILAVCGQTSQPGSKLLPG